MYEIRKDYRDEKELRDSFNELASKTFGLNFENWYQNGFWTDKYNPYSMIENGKVIANVSVNQTDMRVDGTVKHFLQLGTVMTDEAYRKQGLIRKLMEKIDEDYEGKIDGVYLFANDSVLNFYPRFGFQKVVESQYKKEVSNAGSCLMQQIPMEKKEQWNALQEKIDQNHFQGKMDFVGNSELVMFYVSQFMQENVYYCESLDTYVIAEFEEGELFIHMILSSHDVDLEEVIAAFGSGVKKVVLEFTPANPTGYECEKVEIEDSTTFIKGEALVDLFHEPIMFPTLAHA